MFAPVVNGYRKRLEAMELHTFLELLSTALDDLLAQDHDTSIVTYAEPRSTVAH